MFDIRDYCDRIDKNKPDIFEKCKEKITLDNVIPLIDSEYLGSNIEANDVRKPPPPKNPNILRTLSSDLSIRKGKYGPYIFYMPINEKSPTFFKLSKYKTTFANCNENDLIKWIGETYNIPVTYENK